jgi:Peptidase A4 family
MISRKMLGGLAASAATAATALAALTGTAAAAPLAHGQLIHPFNANQSNNWFGYNQGALEQGGKLFSSIAGNWTVPRASQHTKGQAEYSSTWIGIGGGCVDSGCLVTDPTLIQTGTEQDVDSSGHPSYSAWYELIPLPSINISMTVQPGDRMHASIAELATGSNLWKITLSDLTRHETYSTTVPYTSTRGSAEWIDETPLILDTSGSGFAALPSLTRTPFDLGRTNGSPVRLTPSEEMQLVDSNGNVIGTPSAPDSDRDGFGACAWAKTCSAPGS